jgi:hypothetical protein
LRRAPAPALSAYQGDGPGLPGRRAYGLDLALQHFHTGSLDNAFGATAGVNLPVLPGFDGALAYGVSHLSTAGGGRTPQVLSVSAVNDSDADYGKSYLSATIGHAWDIDGLMGATTARDDTFWELGTGIEVAYGRARAANYGVGYGESFNRDGRHPAWRFCATVNHWVSRRTAVVVAFSYERVKHAPDAMRSSLGLRVLF